MYLGQQQIIVLLPDVVVYMIYFFKTIVANGYLAISFVFILMSTTIERTYKQYCTKEGTFLMFLEALIAP